MSYQALLFCSDEKTARVVTQVLTELDFTVDVCNEPFAAVKKLMAQHFDAVVIDCDNEQNATLLFKSARNSGSNQTSLSVAVVEGQAGVANAFRIGANLVLTKPINVEQSKGTLRVARGLLRKADSGKPAASTPEVPRPSQAGASTTVAAIPRPSPAAFAKPTAPPAPAIAASTSSFEIEEEPAPAPEPAEAALLESMPDPTVRTPKPVAAQPAWPTAGPTLSQPMATALREVNQAGTKSSEVASETFNQAAVNVTDTSKLKLGFGSSSHAAAAPAPAREKSITRPAPVSPAVKPVTAPAAVESSAFANLAVKDHEAAPASTSSSRLPMIAIAVVVLAAAGYFGWTKMHRTAAVSTAAIAKPAPVSPAAEPSQPLAAAPSAVVVPDASASAIVHATAPVSAKPSAAKPIQDEEPDVITILPATHAQPMTVKTSVAPQPESRQEAMPAVPQIAAIPSSSGANQIAGIVGSAPTTIPRQTQTLRVSQGVSQGLVVKRVQPIYPEHAKQMRIQGPVLLEATVSKTGDIANVKVLSGDAILARAAADAVRQWKYRPYFLDGEAVDIQTQITVNFKLP